MSANQSVKKKKKPQHAQQNPSNQTNQPLQFTAAPVRIETKKYGLLCRCGQLSKQLFGAGAGKSVLRLKRLAGEGQPPALCRASAQRCRRERLFLGQGWPWVWLNPAFSLGFPPTQGFSFKEKRKITFCSNT